MNKNKECCSSSSDSGPASNTNTKSLYFGTGGTLGIISLLGACGGACSLAAIPLGSLLAAVGLSGLAVYLPFIRWPLFALALIFSFFVLRRALQTGRPVKVAAVALLLGGGLSYSGYQAFLKPTPCEMRSTLTTLILNLSPGTQRIVKEGIYGLWPRYGRSPTVAEITAAMGFSSEAPVRAAFEELHETVPEIFYEGTRQIKWFWPLSNIDMGITVTLKETGAQPVYARCAIDSLGISEMYGKPARITITTPLLKQRIAFDVKGKTLMTKDSPVVVSHGHGCDDTLFFSSKAEFEQYKKTAHKEYLKSLSLDEAFDQGLLSFGKILKS